MASFFSELKRRNVFKVGVAYAIVAWLLTQVVVAVESPLHLPEWMDTFIIILLIVGFPVTLIITWAFELAPDGIKPSEELEEQEFPGADSTPTETQNIKSATPTDTVDRKSIAVLPFANRSYDDKDAYFVDGIHDEILTQLTKISSLKVISRTSVMEYRESPKNMRTIGKELSVATILEGGVQRAGDQVRISVQLIDTNTDEHLWAETYNRELTVANIFEIQEQMATEIATALRANLSPKEQARLKDVPTENMAALEAYFRGKQYIAGRTSQNLAMAIDEYQQAIDLDPTFALAYVGLADVFLHQYTYVGESLDKSRARIETAINQALALDKDLGEVYATLGLLKEHSGDNDGAELDFKRAMALSPNYATAYHWYGTFKHIQGRFDDALAFLSKGTELDPRSAILNLAKGHALLVLNRFDEALAQYKKTIEIAPKSPTGYWGMGLYYWKVSGRLDEAARWFRQLSKIDAETPQYNFFRARLLWDLGDEGQAENLVNHNLEIAPESAYTYAGMMFLNLYHGNESQVIDNANKALAIHKSIPELIRPLRDHDLRLGNVSAALDRYESHYPELFAETTPKINFTNYDAALDLAMVLQGTSERERADKLLNDSLAYIQGIPRLGTFGYGISDVQIYALLGNSKKALAALRQAIDAGWRSRWRFSLENNPNLDSIRNEPNFISMVEEIRTDMASQLARVREIEQAGQI